MAKSIFRKQSLDRVQTIESLDEYIQVTNPGVWLVLAAVVVLLVGACVWGIFGRITVTADALAVANNGQVFCYVSEADAAQLENGMKVRIGEVEGEIVGFNETPTTIAQVCEKYGVNFGNSFDSRQKVCEVLAVMSIANGGYEAQIIVESVQPFACIIK